MTHNVRIAHGPERRYAKALCNAAQSANTLETIEAQLFALLPAFSTADVRAFLANPIVDMSDKKTALNKVLSSAKAHELLQNMAAVMAEHNRLEYFIDALQHAHLMVQQSLGWQTADVRSAVDLGKGDKATLETQLKREYPDVKKFKFNYTVDSDLIAGVRTKVGSKLVDATVRGKLDSLRTALSK